MSKQFIVGFTTDKPPTNRFLLAAIYSLIASNGLPITDCCLSSKSRNFGVSAAHSAYPVPLLPSGPGGVRGTSLHEARSSTIRHSLNSRLPLQSSTHFSSPKRALHHSTFTGAETLPVFSFTLSITAKLNEYSPGANSIPPVNK